MTESRGQPEQPAKPEQELVTQIERAFADVPYPGDDHICRGAGVQVEGSEEANIAAVFRGRHWRDVPLEGLARYSATFCFLTPEAFRFYLPAYLLAVIRLSPEEVERVPIAGALEESLIQSLRPATYDPILWDYRHQRIDPLTPDQKTAVQAFLHWRYREQLWEGSDLFDEAKAVFAYWGYPNGLPYPSGQETNDSLPAVISGARRSDDGKWMVDGKTCQFIQHLIWGRFIHIDQREGGSILLYHDPTDRSYWELAYPHTEMHGGGAPVLIRLSVEQVRTLYSLPALEPY
jgi:hypothetical protein